MTEATKINVMHSKDMKKEKAIGKAAKISVKVATYAFLVIMAIIVIFPFYWMLISSVKGYEEYNRITAVTTRNNQPVDDIYMRLRRN